MNLRTFRSAVLVFLLAFLSSGLIASEWHVAPPPLGNNSNPGTNELPFATIQRGIDAASSGDTVIVTLGTYVENIHFHGKNIVLTSTDPLNPAVVGNTIIDGNQAGSVVTFSGTESGACILSGFTIRNGRAEYGGGILGDGATPQIQHNVISANSGENGGGLAYCNGTIQSNTITDNSATIYGGGLALCTGAIRSNIITGNSAGENGGALDFCVGTIQNNTITGNLAELDGAGLYDCDGTIQNNTITGNSAGEHGGGLSQCHGTVRNCIIWGNTAPTEAQIHESNIPTYCCIEGWSAAGQGDIASEPGFVNPEAHDYHLQEDSPCIDAGATYHWFAWPQRDGDGNCRVMGLSVDMGCYEYGSSTDADGDLLSDADESGAGTDPLGDDSDADGLRDGLEFLRGSNPLEVTAPGVLNVPSEVATIQESLCVSMAGGEIIVAPGTYMENLEFCGPDVILRSSDPGDPRVAASTVIDGGGAGPVVSFMGGESEACVLAGFTIRNGSAHGGGGINGNGTLATIQNNTITANSAQYGGGVCRCDGTIQDNTIGGDSANSIGGGLYGCNGTIQNNKIGGNSAGWGGGLGSCEGTIQNNTLTGNSATYSGGGLAWCNGAIRNCIVWGNTAPSGPQLHESSIPTYSCIEGWTGDSKKNIAGDPCFAGPDTWNFRLLPSSPCIDAGYNDPALPATDIVGMHRIMHGGKNLTVDMGAWEYCINTLSRELGGNAVLTWSSLAGKTYRVERSSDMLAWQTAAENVPSLGNTVTTWTDTTAPFRSPTVRIRYYRTAEE